VNFLFLGLRPLFWFKMRACRFFRVNISEMKEFTSSVIKIIAISMFMFVEIHSWDSISKSFQSISKQTIFTNEFFLESITLSAVKFQGYLSYTFLIEPIAYNSTLEQTICYFLFNHTLKSLFNNKDF
jgi:hypothetical protein